MTWLWLTSCWMTPSWRPGNTGSGRSWTPCWSRTCTSSSRTPRRPLKASPWDSRNHLPLPLLKILFENKPESSPLLTPSNSSRWCQSFHCPWKGNLGPIPQHQLPLQRRSSLGAGPHSRRIPPRCRAPIGTGVIESRWTVLMFLPGAHGRAGGWGPGGTPSSVPRSQENYSTLCTKDHVLRRIIIHKKYSNFQKENKHISPGWVAEFSKSFFLFVCLLWFFVFWAEKCLPQQQLEQHKCFCGTKIPFLGSRMVAPFPGDKYFTVTGVWESPGRRHVLYSTQRTSGHCHTLPRWGSIWWMFPSHRAARRKRSHSTWRPPFFLAFLNQRRRQ